MADFLRLSWRSAFMLLSGFSVTALVLATVLTQYGMTHRHRLVADWAGLFTRCRTVIELRMPLMNTALAPLQSNGDPTINLMSPGTTLLAYEGSRFAVLQQQSGTGANTRYTCKVVLADWSVPLDPDEIDALLYAFISIREELYAAGTHEFRDIGLLPPTTPLAFGTRDRNPAGCATIATFLVEARTGTASTTVGEQIGPCVTANRVS